MPRGDRTGPLGEGPMTGRQLGYGAGFDSPGYTRNFSGRPGRGFRGRGYGRGFFSRGWRWSTPEGGEEKSAGPARLRAEIRDLQSRMDILMDKLNTLAEKGAAK